MARANQLLARTVSPTMARAPWSGRGLDLGRRPPASPARPTMPWQPFLAGRRAADSRRRARPPRPQRGLLRGAFTCATSTSSSNGFHEVERTGLQAAHAMPRRRAPVTRMTGGQRCGRPVRDRRSPSMPGIFTSLTTQAPAEARHDTPPRPTGTADGEAAQRICVMECAAVSSSVHDGDERAGDPALIARLRRPRPEGRVSSSRRGAAGPEGAAPGRRGEAHVKWRPARHALGPIVPPCRSRSSANGQPSRGRFPWW